MVIQRQMEEMRTNMISCPKRVFTKSPLFVFAVLAGKCIMFVPTNTFSHTYIICLRKHTGKATAQWHLTQTGDKGGGGATGRMGIRLGQRPQPHASSKSHDIGWNVMFHETRNTFMHKGQKLVCVLCEQAGIGGRMFVSATCRNLRQFVCRCGSRHPTLTAACNRLVYLCLALMLFPLPFVFVVFCPHSLRVPCPSSSHPSPHPPPPGISQRECGGRWWLRRMNVCVCVLEGR